MTTKQHKHDTAKSRVHQSSDEKQLREAKYQATRVAFPKRQQEELSEDTSGTVLDRGILLWIPRLIH